LIAGTIVSAWIDRDRWIAYHRNRNWYARVKRYYGPLGSYPATMLAVESLSEVGLIDNDPTRPSPNFHWCSRLRASEKLLEETAITCVDHLYRVILEPIRLKDAAKLLIPYREIEKTRDWRFDVYAQNEALRSLSLAAAPGWQLDPHGLLRNGNRVINPAHSQLYRVFNVNWRHGARWYGAWWQQLSEQDRGRLLIDGRPVIEIDYPSHHPTLLAALSGHDLGCGDPYAVAGFPRNEVKQTFNILVNAGNEKRAIAAMENELRENGSHHPRSYVLRLVEAVKQRHPHFAAFWATGIGRRLQCIDGEMCAQVQRIMRKAGHPVLSVHDSFIAGASREDSLRGAMEDTLARTKRGLTNGQIKP
jgi:hypothetical protein